jgi:hypothetical protein
MVHSMLEHDLINPVFKVAVTGWRPVETGKLTAISVKYEGWCSFYREPSGKDRFRVNIDPDDFQLAGPSHSQVVDKGFYCAAVTAPFCPELGQHDLRPIVDMNIIARRRYIDRSTWEFERCLTMSADWMA